jgi:5-methylcytosine-specific restriction endonuclease McrA
MMTDAPQGAKRCTKCGETKPLSEFYRKGGTKGLMAHCKVCHRAIVSAKKASDPEKYKEIARRSAAKCREADPEKFRVRGRAYLAANLDAERARKRDAARRYYATDLGRETALRNANKRRALSRGTVHEPYSRTAIFAAYGNTCAYCDAPAEHLDHVIALSLGGADAAHNLLPACAPCNLGKGAKTLAEWAATFGA